MFSEIEGADESPARGARVFRSPGVVEVGAYRAVGWCTMNQVSTDTKPSKRGSRLLCLRSVAAAGSLLTYWTDFGRLFTKLP